MLDLRGSEGRRGVFTGWVDTEEFKDFGLQRSGAGSDDDFGLWMRRRVRDVVGQRGEVGEQRAQAVRGQAVVGFAP